jgi:glucose-6-phosphate isomerase
MLKVGLSGLLQQSLEEYEVNLENLHHDVMMKLESNSHNIPYLEKNDFPSPKHHRKIAERVLSHNSTVAVVGMGGSVLVPEMIYNLLPKDDGAPEFVFFNTPDPDDFNKKLQKLPFKKTFVVVLSKTGSTIETHMMAQRLVVNMRNNGIDVSKKFLFIIGDLDGSIKHLAQSINASTIPYGSKISGRFSAFSDPCIMLAEMMGADTSAYLEAAKKVVNSLREDKTQALAYQSAVAIFTAYQQGARASTLMAYGEKFKVFGEWYAQLMAESLAKNKEGMFPLIGIGPRFHHDTLQLVLDGPSSNFNTIVHYNDDAVPDAPLEVLFSKQRDNLHTLLQNQNIGYRLIEIGNISESSIGNLIMHFIFEVIILGFLLGVQPTGQPAVERAKAELRELVKK